MLENDFNKGLTSDYLFFFHSKEYLIHFPSREHRFISLLFLDAKDLAPQSALCKGCPKGNHGPFSRWVLQ